MTRKEVSEIFAVWALNWPNAELFKGGKEMLDAKIRLYADALCDVDYWTAQQAALMSLRTRQYAPNIAEFLADVTDTQSQIEYEIREAYISLRDALALMPYSHQTADEVLASMTPRTQKVVEAMGGISVFAPSGKPYLCTEFENLYETMLRQNPPRLHVQRKELP